jgi:hypothetical protein
MRPGGVSEVLRAPARTGKALGAHCHAPLLVNGADGVTAGAPVVGEQRQQDLISADAALESERLPQHRFLSGAKLSESSLCTDVRDGYARFQPGRSKHVEDEIDCCGRREHEQAATPAFGREDELPVGGSEPRLDLAQANQAGDASSLWDHREPDPVTVAAIARRGFDELSEIGRGLQTWCDGGRYLRMIEHRKETEGVAARGLTEGHVAAAQNWRHRAPRTRIAGTR